MARLGSSMVTRIEKGLLILVFVISVMSIGALTTYYVRRPTPGVYALSGGSGELWLTVIAISALEGFLIVSLDEQQSKVRIDEQGENVT